MNIKRSEVWVPILALVVSIVAVGVAVLSDSSQRKHMKLSVTPIPSIRYVQTDELLLVTLKNSGTGPMIINSIRYKRPDGNTLQTIIEEGEFSKGSAGNVIVFELEASTALAAGEKIDLLKYEAVPISVPKQIRNQALRTTIHSSVIEVEYSDIYKSSFDPFFHRLLSKNIMVQ